METVRPIVSAQSAIGTTSIESHGQASTPTSSIIPPNKLSVLDRELPADFLPIEKQRALLDAFVADIQSQTRVSGGVNYITLRVETVDPNVDLFKLFDGNLAKELGETGLGIIRISYDGDTSGSPWRIKQLPQAGHTMAASAMASLIHEALSKHCEAALTGRKAQIMARSHWASAGTEDIRLAQKRMKQPDNSMYALRNGIPVPIIVWEVGQSDSADKNHKDCMSYFDKTSEDDIANIVIGILLDTGEGERNAGPKLTINVYTRPSTGQQVPLPERWVWSLMKPVRIDIQFPFRLFFADQKLATAFFATDGMSEDALITVDQLALQAAFCNVARKWCVDKERWTQELAAVFDRQELSILAQFE